MALSVRKGLSIFLLAAVLVIWILAAKFRRHEALLVQRDTLEVLSAAKTPRPQDIGVIDMERSCIANNWRVRQGIMPRVFDLFQFNSELDMLELRLNELGDVVDYFVLMESTVTHSGKPKKLFFDSSKHESRFQRFMHKIVHVVENDTIAQSFTDAHAREAAQRSSLIRGLEQMNASDTDLVIFADLDEIPRSDIISLLRACEGYDFPVTIHTPVYLYDFGCRTTDNSWKRVKVLQRSQLKGECTFELFPTAVCPHIARDSQEMRLGLMSLRPLTISNGGWHLSFFMSTDQIVDKLHAYSHPERNTAQNNDREYLECLIYSCRHVNEQDHAIARVPDPLEHGVVVPRYVAEQARKGVKKWARFLGRQRDLKPPKRFC